MDRVSFAGPDSEVLDELSTQDHASTADRAGNAVLHSPKISAVEKRSSLYPYYAGYSEAFVQSMFDYLGVQSGNSVLDPWNGGGTTTFVAALNGVRSTGIDVNPVLSSIAHARCAGPRAVHNAAAALAGISSIPIEGLDDDDWLEALRRYRSRVIASVRPNSSPHQARALIDLVFFRAMRGVAHEQRSANPTWFKARAGLSRPNAEQLRQELQSHAARVIGLQSARATAIRTRPSIYSANFLTWRGLRANAYDYVITSPPYLTRIDYAMATYPELRLALGSVEEIGRLRTQMLGTPLTTGRVKSNSKLSSEVGNSLLQCIERHPSKASSTYYYRFYQSYLTGLEESIFKIARAIRLGGQAAIVVQSSYYKEHLVDLAAIVSEMGSACGLEQLGRVDFPQKRSMVNVNSRAVGYLDDFSLAETVVVLGKRAE